MKEIHSTAFYNPEYLYLFGLIVYLIRQLPNETMLLGTHAIFDFVTLLIIGACLVPNMIATIPKYSINFLPLVFISFVVLVIVGINTATLYHQIILFLLVFGAKGISFRKIVKVYLIIGGGICMITVLFSQLGLIPNIIDEYSSREAVLSGGNAARECLGYKWSTNMSNHVFFIIATFFYYKKGLLNYAEIIIIVAISYWVLARTDCRLGALCELLIIIFALLYRFKLIKNKRNDLFLYKLMTIAIPFFMVISYCVVSIYDESKVIWVVVDVLLSGRLSLSKYPLDKIGISLMGQEYKMFASARDDGANYNFIDNSYMQLLIIYGLLYTILICAAYLFISIKAYLRKDYVLVCTIMIIGVSALISQHFIEMYMNPFIIALFAKHSHELKLKLKYSRFAYFIYAYKCGLIVLRR